MTNMTTPAPKPIDESTRYLTIDVVRGVALLGILAMNIMTFSMPFSAYFNPTTYDAVPFDGANKWVYYSLHVLFDMKMMTLFSMLFGVGVMVYAEKVDRGVPVGRVRWLWFKRMFILLGIGLVHSYLIWEGDILVTYAVCGIVLMWWLRRLPAPVMLLVAAPMLLVPTVMWVFGGLFYHYFVDSPELPEWLSNSMTPEKIEETRAQFDEMRQDFAPTPAEARELEATYRADYMTLFHHRAEMSREMQLLFIPKFMLWRGAAVMLIGAALYKWRVVTGERSTEFYRLFTLISYLFGLTLILGGVAFNNWHGFKPGLMLAGSIFNGFGSIPMAMGHMGLAILLARALPTARIVRALSCVGRMALTNYLAHSVIGALIFYGYGFGMYGKLDRLEQQYIVLAVWAAQLIWSPLWLGAFRFGPMEWLWRSLTYGKMQPMRRVRPAS